MIVTEIQDQEGSREGPVVPDGAGEVPEALEYSLQILLFLTASLSPVKPCL